MVGRQHGSGHFDAVFWRRISVSDIEPLVATIPVPTSAFWVQAHGTPTVSCLFDSSEFLNE